MLARKHSLARRTVHPCCVHSNPALHTNVCLHECAVADLLSTFAGMSYSMQCPAFFLLRELVADRVSRRGHRRGSLLQNASDNEEDQSLFGSRRGVITPRLCLSFLSPPNTPCLRLAHGEADAWPGTRLQLLDCLDVQ